MIAQALVEQSGLTAVGFYLALTGGISLIAFDTSARQRALGALARSERRYRSLFEQTHVALCEIDFSDAQALLFERHTAGPDNELCGQVGADIVAACAQRITLVDVNEATVRLLGCASHDAVLGPIDRFLPPDNDLLLLLLRRICGRVAGSRRRGASCVPTGGRRL